MSYLLCFAVCLVWVSISDSVKSSKPLYHPDERLILLNFRNSFTINFNGPMNELCPSPPAEASPLIEENCCQWDWVYCDTSTGHVVDIDLGCSGLNGSISSLSILFQLTHLHTLLLYRNYISGELPSLKNSTNNLSHLWRLDLGENLLYGRIPSWVSNLPSVEYLRLSANRFTGPLIDLIGNNATTSLQSLDLSENEFYGPVHELMFLSPNLTHLRISSNYFNDTIKLNDIFSRFKNLDMLDLSNNNLHVVPTSMSDFEDSNSTWPNLSSLKLSDCNLGQFPFLGAIGDLLNLDVANNNLRGEIPEWLRGMSESSATFFHVWLDISRNSLTSGLDHLPWYKSASIDISSNLFDEPLPSIQGELCTFVASNNRLSGKIDPTICDLDKLIILDLSNNTLSGEIPYCLLNSIPPIALLNLQSNNFHGSIPENISNCEQLLYLDLSDNQLEGKVPSSLAQCTRLQVLNLANNKLSDTFPYWLSSLAYLEVLSLRWNNFYGGVLNSETEHPLFPKLRILDISNNNFNGKLPIRYIKSFTTMMSSIEHPGNPQYLNYLDLEYFSVELTFKGADRTYVKIITTMVVLDFSNNKFDGEIPDSVGQLVALRGLNLSHNHLTGLIPPSLCNLTSLEFLDLSCNSLTGHIPEELARLTCLAVFNVSDNQLVGLIPQGNNFNTFAADAYQGNPGLYGFPLLGSVISRKPNPGSSMEEEDDDDDCLVEWEIVVMGYGCGIVVGMAWAYYMFSVGKPCWFLNMAHMMEVAILGFVHPRCGGMHGRRRVTRMN